MCRYFNTESHIPTLLQNSPSWLGWLKGETDSRGKFPKYPVDPLKLFKISFQDPKNLMTFNNAINFFEQNTLLSGIGFKLEFKPIIDNKYLVGIDIDFCEGRTKETFDVFRSELCNTYSEVSPSGKGIRLFGLTTEPFDNWTHNHIEVYFRNRFLTVTGFDQRGDIEDITDALKLFNNKYKPQKNLREINKTKKQKSAAQEIDSKNHIIVIPTPNEIANIEYLLSLIDADCSGDVYRNIIFSILSLGWGDLGIDIARKWSKTALSRWNEDYFFDLVIRYDKNHKTPYKNHKNDVITIGTLISKANEAFKKGGKL